MEVYQVIYTSCENSLIEPSLGLTQRPGHKIYSCSEGLSRENLDEIIRFSSYRLPKNNTKEYSDVVGDPNVSDGFYKVFRTIRLSDQKIAVIQSVFAGVDYQGYEGNFFAHAFVFDEYDADFIPERFYGSKSFRKYLTTEEAECEKVEFLPKPEMPVVSEGFDDGIYAFVNENKKKLSYLVNSAIKVLTDDDLNNLCIVTKSEEETAKYLIALKYLLPRDMAENMGISTYNVYLPSDRQEKVIFHGTIRGANNITSEAIEYRKNCLYIEMDKLNIDDIDISPLLEKWSVEELRQNYSDYKIKTTEGLLNWVGTYENVTKAGMGSKLLRLRQTAGETAFIKRANEIYPQIQDDEYSEVRFEITKVMYDNIDYFQKHFASLIQTYIRLAVTKLCEGESYDLSGVFSSKLNERSQVVELKKQMSAIMELVGNANSKMSAKNKFILLGFFAHIKHKFGDESWKDFFAGNKRHLETFVGMGAQTILTGNGIKPFESPSNWTKEDMCEFVAFLEASTEDMKLVNMCLKYIYSTTDVDWTMYGITKTKHIKTKGAQKADMDKIHSMLKRVGYEPYNNGKYTDLSTYVHNDMEQSVSPLLITRTLYTYHQWLKTYGDQVRAKEKAIELRELLLEMKKTQKSLYNYMIPKLALEIIESRGHYHEIIINTETMYTGFWNWFLIGYNKCKRDDEKALTYTRIYRANQAKMSRLPVRKKLRAAFGTEN